MGRKREKPLVIKNNPIDLANKVIDSVREHASSCIVMMSLGKDSIVTLDLLYSKFERIVCIYMYFVKDLEHINRWIKWLLARYPKIEFEQIPHWNTTYNLRWGIYCVANPKVRVLNLSMVVKQLKQEVKTKAAEKAMESEAYVMLAFDNVNNKESFMRTFGFVETDKVIKGETLMKVAKHV